MRPTRNTTLALHALAATVGSALFARYLVGSGSPLPVSPLNLILALVAIAGILAALALPIWRYQRALRERVSARVAGSTPARPAPKRPEPFYAVRVLMAAKASALAAAWFFGWHAGVLIIQLMQSVVTDSLWRQVLGLGGSLLLAVVAKLVERACRLPDDDEQLGIAQGRAPNSGVAA